MTRYSRKIRMRSSLVIRASDCQCTSCIGPGFNPSIRRHSRIWGAADEAVFNIVRKKEKKNSPPKTKKSVRKPPAIIRTQVLIEIRSRQNNINLMRLCDFWMYFTVRYIFKQFIFWAFSLCRCLWNMVESYKSMLWPRFKPGRTCCSSTNKISRTTRFQISVINNITEIINKHFLLHFENLCLVSIKYENQYWTYITVTLS
jgi:hypothetical protein